MKIRTENGIQIGQIPSWPVVGKGDYDRFDIGRIARQGWGSIVVYDIGPEAHTMAGERGQNLFLEVLQGAIGFSPGVTPISPARSGSIIQYPDGSTMLWNDGRKSARVLVIKQERGEFPIAHKQWRLKALPAEHDERPEPLRQHVLRSVWKHTDLTPGIGYERVWINGLVPKHRHEGVSPGESGSMAIVMILAGEGQCGLQRDGEEPRIYPVSPGMIFAIPPEMWHGFIGKGLEIISIQIPEIDEKYQFADDEFPYSYQ